MELQTENGKKKVPLSTGLKWLRLVCMAVVFGIIAGGVMVGMNYLGGSMAAEEESIPQTSTVKVTAKAEDSDAVVAVAREAMPSVVTISTMSVEEMRSFFGGTQEIQVQGAGTGVIVNKNESELLIATNNHVVEGASQLSVGFVDQSSVEAQVKGTDVDNDLAVVAVQLSDIPAETLSQLKIATIGDSDELELGQPVVAIGNALGYGQSVTTGVVSALNRDLSLTDESGTAITSTGLIQTDAAINLGNSGGALLNMAGELIGINEAKTSSSGSGGSVDNIGFAIAHRQGRGQPEGIDEPAHPGEGGPQRGLLPGHRGGDHHPGHHPAVRHSHRRGRGAVEPGSPAEKAGIQQGDVITQFDGRAVANQQQLSDTLQYYKGGGDRGRDPSAGGQRQVRRADRLRHPGQRQGYAPGIGSLFHGGELRYLSILDHLLDSENGEGRVKAAAPSIWPSPQDRIAEQNDNPSGGMYDEMRTLRKE